MTVRAGLPLFTTPTRAHVPAVRAVDRQPSQRIRDQSPTYGVAIEAYTAAIDRGCDERITAALWEIVQREHDAWLMGQERR